MRSRSQGDRFFPLAKPGDICLTFQKFQPGALPLTYAAIKTENDYEVLSASMTELGRETLLSVQPGRCGDASVIFRPIWMRRDEIAGYAKRSCVLHRNGDQSSNFYAISDKGDGTIWVRNEGGRSLRFQMPDGTLYRVCAGYTEALSGLRARQQPARVLLDLGGSPLDFRISAVYAKYGETPWQRGGLDNMLGAHVDSYLCRVYCGDDCLGVVESHSDYFLENPRLAFLDIETYGPCQWFVRNKGEKDLALTWPDGRTAYAPADGQIYRLEALAAYREEEGK